MTTRLEDKAASLRGRAVAVSCDAYCEKKVWTGKDHKLLIDALDAFAALVRATKENQPGVTK